MLLPIPEEVLQAEARERTVDMLLSSLGISAAAVSASFAAYMIVASPGSGPARQGDLIVAAVGVGPTHAAATTARTPSADDSTDSTSDGIDFTPTGSIADAPAPARKAGLDQAAKAILPDFAVRDVFDGTALVEAGGTLQMVRAGSDLAGAGKVLAVARNGRGWTVSTTSGLILQRR